MGRENEGGQGQRETQNGRRFFGSANGDEKSANEFFVCAFLSFLAAAIARVDFFLLLWKLSCTGDLSRIRESEKIMGRSPFSFPYVFFASYVKPS